MSFDAPHGLMLWIDWKNRPGELAQNQVAKQRMAHCSLVPAGANYGYAIRLNILPRLRIAMLLMLTYSLGQSSPSSEAVRKPWASARDVPNEPRQHT